MSRVFTELVQNLLGIVFPQNADIIENIKDCNLDDQGLMKVEFKPFSFEDIDIMRRISGHLKTMKEMIDWLKEKEYRPIQHIRLIFH